MNIIQITLVEDEKIGGYTIFSDYISSAIAEGNTVQEALHNFADVIDTMEKYNSN